MGELVGLNTFPLTGAQALSLEEATFGPVGIIGDRQFVAYAPDTYSGDRDEDGPAVHARVSQKQQPKLARLAAHYDEAGDLHVVENAEENSNGSEELVIAKGLPGTPRQVVYVEEFGDRTICLDAGDKAAEFLSTFLDREVRLACKTERWMAGQIGPHPRDRAVAAAHIVVAESVAAYQTQQISFDSGRFRPTAVVEGYEPGSEYTWVAEGKALRIGGLVLTADRSTQRCKVPGNDQRTGAVLRDVPRLYSKFPKAEDGRSPIFGIYATPLLMESGQRTATIRLHDTVEVVDLEEIV